MAPQFVDTQKPDTTHAGDSGFLRRPEIIWLAPPCLPHSFEFFCIENPHFYVIHGVPMAFISPEANP